jgi:hypothetical protein
VKSTDFLDARVCFGNENLTVLSFLFMSLALSFNVVSPAVTSHLATYLDKSSPDSFCKVNQFMLTSEVPAVILNLAT